MWFRPFAAVLAQSTEVFLGGVKEKIMFGSQPPIDYSESDLGAFQEGSQRRSRKKVTQTVSRSRRSLVKKRRTHKHTGPPIIGIGHRRKHKWSW